MAARFDEPLSLFLCEINRQYVMPGFPEKMNEESVYNSGFILHKIMW